MTRRPTWWPSVGITDELGHHPPARGPPGRPLRRRDTRQSREGSTRGLTRPSRQTAIESPAGSNRVKYNTAYYGRAVSGSAYPWCCVFVWWVFRQAGLEALLGGKTASCTALKNQLKQLGRSVDVRDMAPGDLVFYNWRSGAKSTTANHVGIVERVNADGSYVAIEGNTSLSSDDDGGKVMRRTRKQNVVCAVARPNYNDKEEQKMEEKDAPADWAKIAWEKARARGALDGTRPRDAITRQEVAVILDRLGLLGGA